MQKVAKFHKVSFEQFTQDVEAMRQKGVQGICLPKTAEEMKAAWDAIILPTRATSGSAGYDFYTPFRFNGHFGGALPTGVRCEIAEGWFLMCVPKSGLGFKYGMRLKNTSGIIDSDFFYADNEGHIMAKFLCEDPQFVIEPGQKFMQGILLPYGVTEDDTATGVRTGGFGSTGK